MAPAEPIPASESLPPKSTDLTVPKLEPLAHRLASRHRRRESDHWDLVQEAQLHLLDTARRRAGEDKTPIPGIRYAREVMRSAMEQFYRRPVPGTQEWEDLEDPALVGDLPVTGWKQFFERVFLRELLAEAERVLSPEAMTLLEELRNPSPATLEECQKAASPRRSRLRYVHIQRAKGWSRGKLWRTRQEVREFGRRWLAEHPDTFQT